MKASECVRPLALALTAVLVAWLTLTPPVLGDPVPVTGTVTWSEGPSGDQPAAGLSEQLGSPEQGVVGASEEMGIVPFQGTRDASALQGILSADGQEIRVTGTTGADGAVSGTLAAADGAAIGTFEGAIGETQQLEGSYYISDGGTGTWSVAPPPPPDQREPMF